MLQSSLRMCVVFVASGKFRKEKERSLHSLVGGPSKRKTVSLFGPQG